MNKSMKRTKAAGSKVGVARDAEGEAQAVVGAIDQAERSVEAEADRLAERTHFPGGSGSEGGDTSKHGARRPLENAGKALARGYTRGRGELSRAATATASYLSENSGKALLLATSAAVAVGGFLSWRRRPSKRPLAAPADSTKAPVRTVASSAPESGVHIGKDGTQQNEEQSGTGKERA